MIRVRRKVKDAFDEWFGGARGPREKDFVFFWMCMHEQLRLSNGSEEKKRNKKKENDGE